MPESDPEQRSSRISTGRIIIWIVVAAVGLWLVGTGVAGIIAKG